MKTIILTQGKVTLVDDADYNWLNQWKWCADKVNNNWYVNRIDCTSGVRVHVKMHRLILGLTDPEIHGDHENHNGLDNQRHNLRIATRSQNARNKTSAKNSSSKYLGVYWHTQSKKWRVEMYINKKKTYLGGYKVEEDAAKVYDIKAKEYFGEFANLNFKL